MEENTEAREAMLTASAREARRRIRFRPTREALIAYQAGELTPDEEARVQEYLAVDPDAARFVLELSTLHAQGEDESQWLSEHEAAREWRELQQMLAADGGGEEAPREAASEEMTAAVPETRSGAAEQERGRDFGSGASIPAVAAAATVAAAAARPGRESRTLDWQRYALPLAAGLVLTLLPAFWGLRQQGQVAELRSRLEEPQGNLTLRIVRPRDRRAPARAPLEIPAASEHFALGFVAVPETTYAEFRMDIFDAQGQLLFEREALKPREGAFYLLFSQKQLPAGNFDFRLSGRVAGGSWEEVDIYPIQLGKS